MRWYPNLSNNNANFTGFCNHKSLATVSIASDGALGNDTLAGSGDVFLQNEFGLLQLFKLLLLLEAQEIFHCILGGGSENNISVTQEHIFNSGIVGGIVPIYTGCGETDLQNSSNTYTGQHNRSRQHSRGCK